METAAGSRHRLVETAVLGFTGISAFSSLAVSETPIAEETQGRESCCDTTFATMVLSFGAMLLRHLGYSASESIITYRKAANGMLLYHASVLY